MSNTDNLKAIEKVISEKSDQAVDALKKTEQLHAEIMELKNSITKESEQITKNLSDMSSNVQSVKNIPTNYPSDTAIEDLTQSVRNLQETIRDKQVISIYSSIINFWLIIFAGIVLAYIQPQQFF